MPAPKPRITREDFGALVRGSGLTLSEEQKSELHAAYGYIEAMSARVRPRALTAGVRKAPRHEIAGGGSPTVQRAMGN
jgi:hypothetical protein